VAADEERCGCGRPANGDGPPLDGALMLRAARTLER